MVANLGPDGRVSEISRWPSLFLVSMKLCIFLRMVPYPRRRIYCSTFNSRETEPDDLQIVNSTLFQPVFSASLPVPNEVLGS